MTRCFFSLCVCLLAGCSAHQTSVSPFLCDQESGHILVPVEMQDSTLYFVFDTASEGSSVHFDAGAEVSEEEISVQSSARSRNEMKFLSKPSKIRVGENEASVRFTLDDSTPPILGVDVIERYYWFFDFDRMEVTTSRTNIPIEDSTAYRKIPYEDEDGIFYSRKPLSTISDEHTLIDMGKSVRYRVSEFAERTGEQTAARYDSGERDKKIHVCLQLYARDSMEFQRLRRNLEAEAKEIVSSEVYSRGEIVASFLYALMRPLEVGGMSIPQAVVPLEMNPRAVANNYLTIDFFLQFQAVYIDTGAKIIYVKPKKNNDERLEC